MDVTCNYCSRLYLRAGKHPLRFTPTILQGDWFMHLAVCRPLMGAYPTVRDRIVRMRRVIDGFSLAFFLVLLALRIQVGCQTAETGALLA